MNIKTNSFKKYFTGVLILLFSLVAAQKKFVIVLDAGHGGSDHGSNRSYSDLGYLAEKDITLAVTLKVGKMLEKDNDYKVIYTRKTDIYPSLTERTNLANKSKADFFVSIHVNAVKSSTAYGTETFVQGPNQNKENLEVAKAENDVIYLDEKDKEVFASYDPTSPESLIALKVQQSRYLERSLVLGGMVEDNFVNKDKRLSRGVKQQNLHVLRRNAMPSVLIEMGFVSNHEEAAYISSEKGQNEISESIYNAIKEYKKLMDKKNGVVQEAPKPEKPKEIPLKNDFRILLMSTPNKYIAGDPALKGLNYIFTIKEGTQYKYYYATTNLASVRDNNLKTAKDAGFRNAVAVGFVPNQKLSIGYYTIELSSVKSKLGNNSPILNSLKEVERNKIDGVFYYTYGRFATLEEAVNTQKQLEEKGFKNTIIEKKLK